MIRPEADPYLRFQRGIPPKSKGDYDFNLNIPRYVDTFEEEEEINFEVVQQEITTLDLLTLGESFEQKVDGELRSPQLRFIDWKHPFNNFFHVTAEFEVSV